MSEEYYSVLARTISGASQDPARLREMVYSLARIALRNQLERRFEIELQKQTSALEDAIKRIETDSAKAKALPNLVSQALLSQSEAEAESDTGLTALQRSDQSDASECGDDSTPAVAVVYPKHAEYELLPPIVQPSPYPDRLLFKGRTADRKSSARRRSKFWWRFEIAAAALVGVAIYAVGGMHGEFYNLTDNQGNSGKLVGAKSTSKADETTTKTIEGLGAPSKIDGVAMPTSYGVYAIDQGKLASLQALPIKVPDARISISALISAPSLTTLPDGYVSFIVFRRDLLHNAPDQGSIRLIARVMHTLTFKAGQPATTVDVKGEWAVRSKSYGMSVAPVPGNPEMIVMRPSQPQFSLPAGRYALVVNHDGYDFTVAGRISDLAQCLEETEAVGQSVYSECRKL